MKKYTRIILITLSLILVAIQAYALEPLKFYRTQAGDQTYAIAPGLANDYVLVALTNKAVTVPAGAHFAAITSTADIWVKYGGVAAVPTADVTDLTGSELNPIIRRVEPGQTIGVISAYAAKISITFYE